MHAGDAALLVICAASLRVLAICPFESRGLLAMTQNGWFQIGLYLS